jgi:hypothetical protein
LLAAGEDDVGCCTFAARAIKLTSEPADGSSDMSATELGMISVRYH